MVSSLNSYRPIFFHNFTLKIFAIEFPIILPHPNYIYSHLSSIPKLIILNFSHFDHRLCLNLDFLFDPCFDPPFIIFKCFNKVDYHFSQFY